MLRTRLWMGTLLVVLGLGMVVLDQYLADWFYPFLFLMVALLSLAGCREMLHLLPGPGRPAPVLCYGGITALVVANWLPHAVPKAWHGPSDPWHWIGGAFVAMLLLAFLWEMATYREPGHCLTRIAMALLVLAYLGLFGSFFTQLRWLPDRGESPSIRHSTLALALAIFVPKFGDVGAYFTGRVLGRKRMAPVLSPKKTWEGFAGGLAAAVITTLVINHLGPVFPEGGRGILVAILFGLVVGVVGVLGDLAESLIKRDCQKKDASQVLPGYGGVLDVLDSILFSAPIVYLWLC
jgi:phosphatidate cytidylyltransferase